MTALQIVLIWWALGIIASATDIYISYYKRQKDVTYGDAFLYTAVSFFGAMSFILIISVLVYDLTENISKKVLFSFEKKPKL